MRSAGQPRTPSDLQAAVFLECDKQNLPRTAARTLLRLVYLGRAFRFAVGTMPYFRNVYVNDLDEENLLRAYVTSCIFKLATRFIAYAADLSRLLLRDDSERREFYLSGPSSKSKCERPPSSAGIDESTRPPLEPGQCKKLVVDCGMQA
jgi:hypothetical protein